MSLYMKRFVYASLVYLGLAALFGVLNGMTDIGYWGAFAHTHFNLLGFMSMMVFGIGYFILPRFNGSDLRFPGWVAIHFWLANISILGMVAFRGLAVETGEDIFEILFIISASIQVITITMFIINIWLSLSPKEPVNPIQAESKPIASAQTAAKPAPAPQAKAQPENSEITADSKIAELYDRNPEVLNVLVNEGLKTLGSPGHIDKVRMVGVTLGMAAANHGLKLDTIISKVKACLDGSNSTSESSADSITITANILIGDVIAKYPKSKDVFSKYFGDGCFDCPGQSYESVDLACRMHGVEPNVFLEELNIALNT